MLREGISSRKIARHLREKHGLFSISYGSVYRHHRNGHIEDKEHPKDEKKSKREPIVYVKSTRSYRSQREKDREQMLRWSREAFGN